MLGSQLTEFLQENGISSQSFRAVGPDDAVFQGEIPAPQAIEIWQKLTKQYRSTGYWPILRGNVNELSDFRDADASTLLASAPAGSIRAILEPRFREQVASFTQMIDFLLEASAKLLSSLSETSDFDDVAAAVDASGIHSFGGRVVPTQTWPSEPLNASGELHFHTLQQRGSQQCVLTLIRCQHPFEAPAYLGFGGWNECPAPEIHVAVLREWEKSYGAVPACITGDVLECAVSRPPQTQDEAMKLAADQWIYCDDIVGQGTQTIRKLAIEIWKSPTWFFWWD